MIQEIEIDGKPTQIEIPDDATPEEVDAIVNSEAGGKSAPPKAPKIDEYGRTLVNGIAQVSKDDPLARGNELKTLGAKAKAPIKAGVDLLKNIPESLKAQTQDFGGYYKGVGKGVAQGALDLTINPILGIRNIGAARPVDNAIKVPEAKSEAEKTGMQFGAAGTNIAAALLPVKKVPGASAIKEGVAQGAENFAVRNQNRLVKINSPEWNKGARPETSIKYGVAGDKAEQAIPQWENIKKTIFESLDKKVAGKLNDPANITSVDEIKSKAIEAVNKSKLSELEKVKQINGIEKYFEDPDFKAAYPDGKLNIVQANRLKIDTGRKGAWFSSGNGARVDPDAPIKAQVANAIYDGLKKTVENKGTPGVKELNKALSEIIPMQLAAEKRLMVDKRSNFVSLDDVVGAVAALAEVSRGNLGPAAFAVGNAAVKSPAVGKAAFKISQALRGQSVPKGIKEIQDAINMKDTPPTAGVSASSSLYPVLPTGYADSPEMLAPTFMRRNISLENPQVPPAARNYLEQAPKTIDEKLLQIMMRAKKPYSGPVGKPTPLTEAEAQQIIKGTGDIPPYSPKEEEIPPFMRFELKRKGKK